LPAADAERRRIERDLHDGAQQRLVALSLKLGMARKRLGDDADGMALQLVDEAQAESRAVPSTAGVVAECLTNIGKYANATSATVRVRPEVGRLVVEVVDDGIGGADAERGSGLRGLADRVGAVGGSLEVASPQGHGTRVRAEIPLVGG
jgi:signal transduction histidine kinase